MGGTITEHVISCKECKYWACPDDYVHGEDYIFENPYPVAVQRAHRNKWACVLTAFIEMEAEHPESLAICNCRGGRHGGAVLYTDGDFGCIQGKLKGDE